MSFKSKLLEAARKNKSWLCVGLDPAIDKIPSKLGSDPGGILEFNRAIIEATSDLVCAYKPNAAFYECMGAKGWEVLEKTVLSVPSHIPVIIDAKRGDIGNTAAMYAKSIFEGLGADAVTVNPYLGRDSIEPFTRYLDKGVIILCLTSNKSSNDIQRQLTITENQPETAIGTSRSTAESLAEFLDSSTKKIYEHIAGLAVEWNVNDNIGLVVGATAPKELGIVREIVGEDIPFLIPGVGAQGGDLQQSIEHGSNADGELAIINVARGIIYGWTDESNYESQIREAALSFKERIQKAIEQKAAAAL